MFCQLSTDACPLSPQVSTADSNVVHFTLLKPYLHLNDRAVAWYDAQLLAVAMLSFAGMPGGSAHNPSVAIAGVV